MDIASLIILGKALLGLGEKKHICQGLAKYSDPPANTKVNPAWLSCIKKHGVPPKQ